MDFNKIVARAKAILLTPKTEWPVVAGEAETTQSLLVGYVLPLAAVAAIAQFIKSSIIGYGGFGFSFRTGIGSGLVTAVISVAVSILWIFLMALIIDALAPTFGGTKDRLQAMKTAAYAATASWLASVFYLLGAPLGALASLIGLCYGGYLMIVGLPYTMKAPAEKATGYGVVSILCAIVLSWVLAAIVGSLGYSMGGGFGRSGMMGSTTFGSGGGSVTVNGGALGGLAAFADKAEKASKEMEAAQKSGDSDAQAKAAANLVGTVLGGGEKVESLSTDRIKAFLPATLAGLKQESSSAERNGAMGMQVSEARATYSDGNGKSVRLEITDMGSARGLMGLASWANIEEDKQTSTGYEKTYKQGDTMIHERWDNQSKDGEYSAMVAGRFMVKVEGEAGSINELKAALGGVDLAGLAALKNEGVKTAAN